MRKIRNTDANTFTCKICRKPHNNLYSLIYHIKKYHNTQYNDYCNLHLKDFIPKCRCGKFVYFISYKSGFDYLCESCKQKQKENIVLDKISLRLKKHKTCVKCGNEIEYKHKKQHRLCENCKKEITKIRIKSFRKIYGVENPSQIKEIYDKTRKSCFQMKQYKDTNIWYQASYELDFLNKYYKKFKDEIQRGPSIKYKYKRKNKVYYPDFYIPSLNLIVEIKNSYHYKKRLEIIKAKEIATIKSGYKYNIIIDKNYTIFESLLRKS